MKAIPLIVGDRFIVVAIAGFLFVACNAFTQGQPNRSQLDHEATHLSTNAPPPGFATRRDYLNSFTNKNDAVDAFHAGLLDKDEAAMAMMAADNKASVDIYAKVVDQNGDPVAGAKVKGFVKLGFGDTEEHDTITDAQGQFSFIGLHGQGLGIRLQKEGYEYGPKTPFQRAAIYVPDPNNPVTITMWKEHGAEPMRHDKNFYKVAADGRLFTIDLTDNRKTDGTNAVGDLRVWIQRPAQIKRAEKFDWRFSMTATDGGLIEVTNVTYLNEAPQGGYQLSYEVNMSSTDTNWQEEITKVFFLKTRNGHVYGHLSVTVIPNYNDVSVFKIESFINPAGSRNLEFDPQKQIR